MELDITGRVIEVGFESITLAYLDQEGNAATIVIRGHETNRFRLGDMVRYTERITIERVVSD